MSGTAFPNGISGDAATAERREPGPESPPPTAPDSLPRRASEPAPEADTAEPPSLPAESVPEPLPEPTPDSLPGNGPERAPDSDLMAPLWAALRQVMDPEFPISLVDLGLIYGMRREGGVVEVDLTFTATACPCMDFIREDIRERLLAEPDVREVRIREVWDPPWTRERMTAEGKAILKRAGVAA
ncbi:MAG TPA: iron-sulfur cluster assembly protein [Longimicrobiales bacterium]|nr:iron-sulfur cluster assembly protein [Longimicrobiales bacterium]